MNYGVIVGKFYPFHVGHKYLIEEALKKCNALNVVVTEEQDQAYAASERAMWILKEFEGVEELRLHTTRNDIPNTPEAWAKRTLSLKLPINGVFTSEDYGPAWAEAMGVEHNHVDIGRERFPISGTEIRADLMGNWQWLAPATKSALAPRVVIIGAESTGSTTLAKGLAEYFATPWVPEFGREWWDARWFADVEPSQYEFDRIVDGQNRMADELSMLANRVLICDSDNLSTVVFEERYLGTVSERTVASAAANKPDLYIHTGTDIKWVNDGLRESEKERVWMSEEMFRLAHDSGVPTVSVTGNHLERMEDATGAVNDLLREKFYDNPLPITEVT